jgi:hypothetical protein
MSVVANSYLLVRNIFGARSGVAAYGVAVYWRIYGTHRATPYASWPPPWLSPLA